MRKLDRKHHQIGDLIDGFLSTRGAVARIELLMDGIAQLLDAEVAGFNHLDLLQRQAFVHLRPKVVPDPSAPVLHTLDVHPVVRHYRDHPREVGPCRLSDLIPGRVEDHVIYPELLRPMGTPHMITVPLPWKGSLTTGSAYAVTRSGSDFTDEHLSFACVIQQFLRLLHDGENTEAASQRLSLLTEAEREVADLIGRGLTADEAARRRGCSVLTLRRQRANVYAKLGIHDRATLSRLLGHHTTVPHPADRLKELFDPG
jgi:DNA-binding CsgD family transcriptional regulator